MCKATFWIAAIAFCDELFLNFIVQFQFLFRILPSAKPHKICTVFFRRSFFKNSNHFCWNFFIYFQLEMGPSYAKPELRESCLNEEIKNRNLEKSNKFNLKLSLTGVKLKTLARLKHFHFSLKLTRNTGYFYHRKREKTRIRNPIQLQLRIVRQPKSGRRIPRRRNPELTETFSDSDRSSSDVSIQFVLDVEFRIGFDIGFYFEKIDQSGFANSKRNLNSSFIKKNFQH